VEVATARSFILNRGIVTDTMSATPLELELRLLRCLGGRQVLRHCAFTLNPHRPVSPSAGHRPG